MNFALNLALQKKIFFKSIRIALAFILVLFLIPLDKAGATIPLLPVGRFYLQDSPFGIPVGSMKIEIAHQSAGGCTRYLLLLNPNAPFQRKIHLFPQHYAAGKFGFAAEEGHLSHWVTFEFINGNSGELLIDQNRTGGRKYHFYEIPPDRY